MADGAQTSTGQDLSRVSNLTDAVALIDKVKAIKQARGASEKETKLNLAFYRGNQWVWADKRGRVQALPSTDTGELPRWRVRLTSNQILPGVQAYLAMMTKTKPVISATPNTGDDSDIKAAQTAEQLFEQWWRDFNLKVKLQEALLWGVLGTAGYWKISWDPQAGKGVKFLFGPDGQPVLNPELAALYREQLTKADPTGQLVQQFEKTIYMGDIRVDVFGPHQIYLDPTATSFEDADWVICEHPMSPDEIKSRWGVTVEADSVVTDFETAAPLLDNNVDAQTQKTVKKVYIGYFKPTPALPKGRYVVFMEGPNKILDDQKWYFPFTELPLVKFGGPKVPGSAQDEALVTHARPYQKLINAILSKVVEHIYLTIRPQMIAPENSLRQRLTNEPGAVFTYTPIASAGGVIEPQWREMPTIPPYVFTFLEEVQGRIDRLFNLQAITRGDVPPNVEAGVAIDLLQEAAVDQVAPVIQGMEDGLARAGNLMVQLGQKYYTEPRLLKVVGPGGVYKSKQFQAADIAGGFNFHAEAGSGLPRTRAGRQARIERFVEMGVLRPDTAWKYLDIADLKGLGAAFAADEEQAQREHEKIIQGQPINPIAQMEAIQAVQAGMNPDTGQPLGPTDNPMQIVQDAGLKPTPFENLQTHMDAHALWMKSVEFEALQPEQQQAAYTHFLQTRQTFFSIPQLPQPQAVRTTLQLKGTVDPDTASQILEHSGVPEASGQNLRQTPLETWLSDDMTKPKEQDAGNDQMTAEEHAQMLQHNEEQHQAKLAAAAHNIALTGTKIDQASSPNGDERRAEELHQQKMQQLEEQHAERLRQMRKPKPKAT